MLVTLKHLSVPILLLIMIGSIDLGPSDREMNSAKNVETQEIPFMRSPEGHIIVQAAVNGHTGTFIFDTGGGVNLISRKFADKIGGLKKTDMFYTGHRATGEALTADIWIAESVKLASYIAENQNMVIYEGDFPVDGLIGLQPFIDKIFTIDFDNNVLRVESDKSLIRILKNDNFVMPLLISNDRGISFEISTVVELNEEISTIIGLDTGAGTGSFKFNSRYMSNLGIDSSHTNSKLVPSPFKEGWSNRYYSRQLTSLTNSGKNLMKKNIQVSFVEGLLYGGITSIDWLGKVITIDLQGSRLIISK